MLLAIGVLRAIASSRPLRYSSLRSLRETSFWNTDDADETDTHRLLNYYNNYNPYNPYNYYNHYNYTATATRLFGLVYSFIATIMSPLRGLKP